MPVSERLYELLKKVAVAKNDVAKAEEVSNKAYTTHIEASSHHTACRKNLNDLCRAALEEAARCGIGGDRLVEIDGKKYLLRPAMVAGVGAVSSDLHNGILELEK